MVQRNLMDAARRIYEDDLFGAIPVLQDAIATISGYTDGPVPRWRPPIQVEGAGLLVRGFAPLVEAITTDECYGDVWVDARLSVLERETGHRISLAGGSPRSTKGARVAEVARAILRDLVLHELDECLYWNGIRFWDPHRAVRFWDLPDELSRNRPPDLGALPPLARARR